MTTKLNTMKILFIRPKQSSNTIGLQHIIVCEPLELEVLAALVDESTEVKIVDMIHEKKSLESFIYLYRPDVVCVTGYITNIPMMRSYCERVKFIDQSIITIAGGVHIEVFPDDLNHSSIDFRVVRNATTVFPKLLEHIKGNVEKPNGVLSFNELFDRSKLPDFDFYYPIPQRDLIDKYRDKYFYIFHDKINLLKTSFGCPYNCSFCFCIQITDKNYYVRPIGDVLDELETIKGKEIYIVDDDFIVSPKRVIAFINGLKERNIKKRFLIFGRADFIVKYPELIEQFKEVGLSSVIVGFESFNNDELDLFNKELEANVNEEAMHILNSNKVNCYASIIIHPSWGQSDFDKLNEKAKELGIEYVVLQPLTPFPGTDFKVEREKMLFDPKDFEKWDLAHIAIKPEKLSLAEFYKNIVRSYNKIAFSPRVLFRHMKYPLRLQLRIIRGLSRIRKQYNLRYKEALKDA